ncbi:hypothetical protein [Kumtagia ephedrae]|jgi:hypothetical protein|uniref:Uncharacterized protein n=1 Tax=Kumtagia ephedrae TaxID=2116701 RepID=A0A2P7RSB4_9HYPH|nr:hypothetical protein [Mesorhizobium ephedrae]PSJ53104.1 hypothetical protein C7I84_25995 [Mesorhizobium ephedrae]
MEQNRIDHALPGRLDQAIFNGFGDDDSIVDRLLALPVATPAHDGKPNVWEAGVARRLEKLLADEMRERIEGKPER